MTDRICNQCERPARVRGMCRARYMAWYRSGVGQAAPKVMGRPPESPKPCTAPSCDRNSVAHGLCLMHYERQRKTGRLDHPSVEEQFFARVTERDGCWEYAGLDPRGYGQIQIDGQRVLAHRWSYEFLVAPIPEGLDLDHLCRNTACVNPWHLEPVTARVNTLRGIGPAAINAAKTHCIRNHPFDAVNTYIAPNGSRKCRTCRAMHSARCETRRQARS